MSHEKKKKNNNNNYEEQQFEFCEVCKLNHSQGRRHNFFPSHKSSLSTLLTRFQTKLSDVKFFLKSPMPIRPEHAHQNRLWCVFCNCDILELDSPFACGNAIQHLASLDHWKRVKGFMWKYGSGMDRVDLFRISEVDYAKWEKKCKSSKTEASKEEPIGPVVGPLKNIHNEMNADSVNNFQKNDIDSHNFCILNGVVPLHSYTNERTQVQSGVKLANGEKVSPGVTNLTQISSTPKKDIQINVHSGAPPPWFDATNGNQLTDVLKPEQGDLVSSKARKFSKLNPKRVGAAWAERRKLELELERRGERVNSNYDANWLPNFGRVWQSGTRKESRKQFQLENKASSEADDESEMLVPLQPYISKRMFWYIAVNLGAMVAEAKGQTAASSQDAFVMVSSQMEHVTGGNSYTQKVRKPYTITKQRERWTEDEHRKFVEALKLYGRAWRHIEEHVGTKTAIQIRSHAQKFFAKVMRDSNIDGAGCLNRNEIPPPRPKKKPLYPYPRKLVDPANAKVIIVSHSPDERANRSPTSVLPVIDYDEMHKSSLSPASCATDAHSACSLFTERGDEYVKSEISAKEEIGSCSSVRTSFASVPDNKSNMKFELFHQEGSSYTSIKLFGKTVVVRDAMKQSSEVSDNAQSSSPPDSVRVKIENNTDEVVQGLRSTNLNSQVIGNDSKSIAPCFLPQLKIVKLQPEEHKDGPNSSILYAARSLCFRF
ncbi:titan-like protein [Phtheirospermum japonicum]|uniref:Titan-like protein n=1 Tax=Phtheirospermum japonicum TaxID=374723 RepID=A0A830CY13_9LAMI|nr:titan-like protein [Phtheirospermum japonicum]